MTKIHTKDIDNCYKNDIVADATITFEFTQKGMELANLKWTHSLSVIQSSLQKKQLKKLISKVKSFNKAPEQNIHLEGDFLIPFCSFNDQFPVKFMNTHEGSSVDICVKAKHLKHIYIHIAPTT